MVLREYIFAVYPRNYGVRYDNPRCAECVDIYLESVSRFSPRPQFPCVAVMKLARLAESSSDDPITTRSGVV